MGEAEVGDERVVGGISRSSRADGVIDDSNWHLHRYCNERQSNTCPFEQPTDNSIVKRHANSRNSNHGDQVSTNVKQAIFFFFFLINLKPTSHLHLRIQTP